MSLPKTIEILPLEREVQAVVTVPGSKSITNRALILAALGRGKTVLRGALWSEDTQVMVQCLHELGFAVSVESEPGELCNRTITVEGRGGAVPAGRDEDSPLELFVANAGTAARFLAAFVCLGSGVYRLHGTPRMHERPQAALFEALRQLGYKIQSDGDHLPVVIRGAGPRLAQCQVDVAESSQFASALLLCARAGGWQVEVTGESEDELPYVAMTSKLVEAFPQQGGEFTIEPDASSGSYFWAAGKLAGIAGARSRVAEVRVAHWPSSGWQVDQRFPQFFNREKAIKSGELFVRQTISRRTDLGDSIMTAIVLAPFSAVPVRFTDLGRLRLQECERVAALRGELTKCGARVTEEGDTLTVCPSRLAGAEIDTYSDHRIAMCFAVLGLRVPGMRIRDPGCVRKTFPDFFQKLAGLPPGGLGTSIKDRSGRTLSIRELLAD